MKESSKFCLIVTAAILLQTLVQGATQVSVDNADTVEKIISEANDAIADPSSNVSSTENSTSLDPFPYPTNGRLPTWIVPSHYIISLNVFLYNATYDGSVVINITVRNETDKIVLNAVDLIIIHEACKVILISDVEREIPIKNQAFDTKLQFYVIHLNETLQEFDELQVSVAFQGILNSKLVGFYLSTYNDANGNKIRVASTQFSPTDARRAFPCFDEPSFKATFDINIERDENVTALSNMPILSTSPSLKDERRFVDRFERSLKMSTYVVGFLISNFAHKSSDYLNGTEFKVWAREEAINQVDYSLEVGPPLVLFLEDYFGTEYPLPKLDMAAIPNFKFNGMENWGLIMFRESALLFDPLVSTINSKRNLIQVVAHEIAHMWFGNLVTPKWWSDLWLKEGFSNFMGYMAVDSVEPSWKMMDYLVGSNMYSALSLDSLESSHPINVEVDNPDRISEIFDDISYNKGASIIRMMYHFLTDEVFKKGMQNYIRGLQYQNAAQEDLWGYLTQAWKESNFFNPERTVEKIMNTWTLQEGYPVITATRNGSQVCFTQQRYLLPANFVCDENSETKSNESLSTSTECHSKWWIPISFVKESEGNFNNTQPFVWMNPEEHKACLNDTVKENEWFIVNLQKSGFYRVNYDNNTWYLLLNQLLKDHLGIHHLNRVQILDDALNLARAGLIDYSLPLQMAKYMKNEKDLTVWKTFASNYNYIYQMAKSTTGITPFNNYMKTLIVPLYNMTGFADSPNDSYELQGLRILATNWACLVEYEICLENARKLFKLWLELPKNESSKLITSNVKPTVLCYGIKNATTEVWDQTFHAYLNSNFQAEKTDILMALGCTENPTLLTRYLEMALNSSSGIIKQDSSYVFIGASNSKIGQDLAWNIIKERWNFIVEYFGRGSSALWGIIQAPANRFNSDEKIKELTEFRTTQGMNLGSARQTVDQSLERAKDNKDWMDKHFDDVAMWMKDY